jgi:hypothetical protein
VVEVIGKVLVTEVLVVVAGQASIVNVPLPLVAAEVPVPSPLFQIVTVTLKPL